MNPIPGLTIEQQAEAVVYRMALWSEARGEPVLGMLGILRVIENLAVEHDTSMKAVVLKPERFSSFNDDDPNRAKMLTAWKDDPQGWDRVNTVCELYEGRGTVDVTEGSNHYYNPGVVQPSWGRGSPDWQEKTVIGHHVFGRCP